MRGRKKMKEDKILSIAKWVRVKKGDNDRLQLACRKGNFKHTEYMRDALLEKLDREGF